jgi:hypothetical protein
VRVEGCQEWVTGKDGQETHRLANNGTDNDNNRVNPMLAFNIRGFVSLDPQDSI